MQDILEIRIAPASLCSWEAEAFMISVHGNPKGGFVGFQLGRAGRSTQFLSHIKTLNLKLETKHDETPTRTPSRRVHGLECNGFALNPKPWHSFPGPSYVLLGTKDPDRSTHITPNNTGVFIPRSFPLLPTDNQ